MKLDQPVGRWGQDAFSSGQIKKIYHNNEVWVHLGKSKQKQWEKVTENRLEWGQEVELWNISFGKKIIFYVFWAHARKRELGDKCKWGDTKDHLK